MTRRIEAAVEIHAYVAKILGNLLKCEKCQTFYIGAFLAQNPP
jgi:hypothetical protein